jgi:phosphoribosylanthranilate isomerase
MQANHRLLLKAGGIQNLTDARYFSSKAVDMVGFCFDTASPQYINPRDAQQIMGWLEGPKRCGEFGRMDVKAIREAALILGLDYVQMVPEGPAEDYASIEAPIILELPDHLPLNDLLAYADAWNGQAAYILLDYKEMALLPELSFLEPLMARYPVMIDCPVTEAEVYYTLLEAGAAGINLQGTPEEQKGEKSFDGLNAFFALVQSEL